MDNNIKQQRYFVQQLLLWNTEQNDRAMPWKGEKDPYKIWLSEIILQQTRVEQGLDYYNRFIATFPNVHLLAAAGEDQVFKLWEGLGYYSRCKNLIASARHISSVLGGKFPDSYENIRSLKGVGPYTAAAIASFAFNLPHAVVDGNVYRVLSRFFGIETPIDSTEGKATFSSLAGKLLPQKTPGIYNQALMDFGAVICKPKAPQCNTCLLSKQCNALASGRVDQLPVKEKSIIKKTRWLYYFIADYKGKVYVRKRGAKDIWENLYEFILIEDKPALTITELLESAALKDIFGQQALGIQHISGVYRQQLTHQTICGQFFKVKLAQKPASNAYETVALKDLDQLPFPKFITQYLRDKNVSLKLF